MQNLLDDLKELFQRDDRLIVDGNLLKAKIIELTFNLDRNLIKLLLSHHWLVSYTRPDPQKRPIICRPARKIGHNGLLVQRHLFTAAQIAWVSVPHPCGQLNDRKGQCYSPNETHPIHFLPTIALEEIE